MSNLLTRVQNLDLVFHMLKKTQFILLRNDKYNEKRTFLSLLVLSDDLSENKCSEQALKPLLQIPASFW